MKKTYVVPESKLFVLKLNENIADSVVQGEDEVSGLFIISFTQKDNPCRGLYTNTPGAICDLGMEATFAEYYAQLKSYGKAELWGCLSMA